ncbi:transposase family protein [Micromonospora sp. KC207]|uniref:transposase family protein n=1 Tax=Micromonospora sp. KC207 TaxID=2530377 RepID=UPI001FB5BE44|nr:transposase family protein [Micromonospora sp. KC207]
MTGLPTDRLADLIDRVREIEGHEWEKPPVGRPHVLPLPTAVIAVLFGLWHNMPDEVLAEVFGCSQATITRYHQILQPILRWVTRPEVDQRLEQTRREGVLVDGFVAPVGERESYHGLFSGKKHVCGQYVQVVADLDAHHPTATSAACRSGANGDLRYRHRFLWVTVSIAPRTPVRIMCAPYDVAVVKYA